MLFYFLACVALATAAPQKSTYVKGGSDAYRGEFPWQVSLQRFAEDHFCGGALITKDHVLTAAHCKSSPLTVALGSLDYCYAEQFIDVAVFTAHPQYNSFTLDYDFAVITLKSSAVLGGNVNTIDLAEEGNEYTGIASISGWGGHVGHIHDHDHDHVSARSEEEEHDEHLLQKANVPLVSAPDCQQFFSDLGFTITNRMQCIGGDGALEVCKGDLGGPLTVEENGKSVLIAVGSWADEDCDANTPAIYAKVSAARSWIDYVLDM